jgi:hypothetical protein
LVPRVDWTFVLQRFARITDFVLIPVWFVLNSFGLVFIYGRDPGALWPDAHIYYRATETWLAGGNPWNASFAAIRFAAPPPALLLNLPFIPFGESAAVYFWVTANAVSVVYLIRRFRLPWWWIAFYPIFEGFTAATPDLTLAALVFVGAGAIGAFAKPYSVPALLAENRRRALLAALIAGVVTIPLLPWGQFFSQLDLIESTFRDFGQPISALGQPLLMVGVVIALVSLGRERGLGLTAPGLLAQQPHYAVFSLRYIPPSRILIVGMATSTPYQFAAAVIAYALWEWLAAPSRGPRVGWLTRTFPMKD